MNKKTWMVLALLLALAAAFLIKDANNDPIIFWVVKYITSGNAVNDATGAIASGADAMMSGADAAADAMMSGADTVVDAIASGADAMMSGADTVVDAIASGADAMMSGADAVVQ